jgi:SAM-dependent methyltransferase
MILEVCLRIKKVITSLIIRLLKPFYKNERIRRIYWEIYAPEINREWGCEEDDFSTISEILRRYRPSAILDLGCGSGRLFKVYANQNISTILGIDISGNALSIAKQKYPKIPTLRLSVEEITFKEGTFDLIICNRILQHIPPEKIADAIRRLCSCTYRIYINEITPLESCKFDEGLFFHDYVALFRKQQFVDEFSGEIPKNGNGRQFFMVFKKKNI